MCRFGSESSILICCVTLPYLLAGNVCTPCVIAACDCERARAAGLDSLGRVEGDCSVSGGRERRKGRRAHSNGYTRCKAKRSAPAGVC